MGYGLYFYGVVEILGVEWDDFFDEFYIGNVKYSSIFNYFILSWVDIGVIGWLVDGVVIMN